MTDATAILNSLFSAEQTLAFCDETELTEKPTNKMLPDIHMRVALIMQSNEYVRAAHLIRAFRDQYSTPDFHGSLIVGAKKHSGWDKFDLEVRVSAFRIASEAILNFASAVGYVHIPKEQYDAMRASAKEQGTLLPRSQKTAVKRVFTESVIEYLEKFLPAVCIFDKEESGDYPRVWTLDKAKNLVGNGIILVNAAEVEGIQLADMAAYMVGRYIRRRDKILAGEIDPFDEIVMHTVANLNGRFVSLL